MADDFIKTGIPGLDKVLKGGMRRSTALLITGAPGTGKTIMAIQYLCSGAKDYNENGIFITAEETPSQLNEYAASVGLELEKYCKQGKIIVIEKPIAYLKGGLASIRGLLDLVEKRKIKRMVLDSLTFFEYLYPKNQYNDIDFRRQVLLFVQEVKKKGVSLLATAERSSTDLDRFAYMMMDFLFDGFIVLTRVRKGSYYERVMTVVKMKGQEHSLDIYPITIGKGGVTILADQVPFSLVEKEAREGKD